MQTFSLQELPINRLLKAYLNEEPSIRELYYQFPRKNNYYKQAQEKLQAFEHRAILHEVITDQMSTLDLFSQQKENLDTLLKDNCATITTGHQLNLMTGPLYFIYKILQTVKTCEHLNADQTDYNFVPIFWMATEDHDWDEVNHFRIGNEKFQWKNGNVHGAVGSNSTGDLAKNILHFLRDHCEWETNPEITHLIENAYPTKANFSEATRSLVHQLLGSYGILIIDAADPRLKRLFEPIMRKDLQNRNAQEIVEQTSEILENFEEQAFVRKINLFYLGNNFRERLVFENDLFFTADGQKTWSEKEIFDELSEFPERFSPNVILRPIYQETILPNVSYIGGGGEIAYWLQLKPLFDQFDMLFPILVMRNSIHILSHTLWDNICEQGIHWHDFFKNETDFLQPLIEKNSNLFDALDEKYTLLQRHFEELHTLAEQTSEPFATMLNAQEQKQLNGYQNLRKRLYKAEAQRLQREVQNWRSLRNQILPDNQWQERSENFLSFYRKDGKSFFDKIYESISPFESKYHIILNQ